jgi:uncharacterized protein (DUF885 family)
MRLSHLLLLLLALPAAAGTHRNSDIQKLGAEFFAWRATTQPCTGDDIPRVERPAGWVPDVSTEAFGRQRSAMQRFSESLGALRPANWTRADSVDYLLLRSAIERVRWELDILRLPERDPNFYVQQALGSVYELLLVSTPMTESRIAEILLRLKNIPVIVAHAQRNLSAPVAAFARPALADLDDIAQRMNALGKALSETRPSRAAELNAAAGSAGRSLADYSAWIRQNLPGMSARFHPGLDLYVHYLRTIACNPFDPDAMITMARTEYDRAVTFEALEIQRNAAIPQPGIFRTIQEQIAQCSTDERSIRGFLTSKNLMTVPDWLGHYGNRPTPPIVEPLAGLGVPDDLTSESRTGEDAFSYIPPPRPGLSYFRNACALDPRPIIIHEGVPGHFFQMAVSWTNEDPIRRHYFDSGSNEGWGFYVEEMMLQEGIFDNDRPHTRETIYNFMRLRALRVEVDIRLALGTFSLDEGADYLATMVPMDKTTAGDEACFFAATPGQAITYQIGKIQIHQFLKDARQVLGSKFSLKDFHDYIVRNGNVPIALLRYEYLGLDDQVRGLWSWKD